ncbi:MAG TPA: hypothetical protein DDX39_04620 [Bacteroidales bacterium]|nr:MAG: hypothetical protein A2W98_02335 [Bacteroidetes bacterium GWF2_33_38]OFY90959.1 MAG: hypothetical protein A2236_07130 [Bacteroidetes bacterium RIFOXYA2_FULL_33_7]HBF87908.1 hypothetical protein [Bacteroidales bacterium]
MGFFDFLNKNITKLLPDLSIIGTDIHSHLIPGIDDGSKSVEESLMLIHELYELGYHKIVTTPHIMSDYYKNTPEIILAGLERLRRELEILKLPVTIEAAAEYYLDYEFQKKIGTEKFLTLGDNYILFELSYLSPPQSIENVIFNLQTNGYKTILAHPERYIYWNNNFEMYERLKDRDVYFQININSLSGEYSPSSKKTVETLIKKNMVDFIGSDLHNMHHIETIKTLLDNKHLIKLIESGKLLNHKI